MSIETSQPRATGSPSLPTTAWGLLFDEAHTTEWFSPETVDVSLIEEAYDHLRWAPTSMNISPLRLAIVPPGASRAELVDFMTEGNQPKTAAAPLTIIAAADPRFHDHLDVLAPFRTGLAQRLEPDLDRRLEMATSNARIQIGYLILALRGMGLAVGPMGGFDAAALDAHFFAESGWRSLVVLNVGHAATSDGIRPRQGRLSTDQATVVLP